MLKVRAFMRWARGSSWTLDAAAHRLEIDRPQAEELIRNLERDGYVERSSQFRGDAEPHYEVTTRGNGLAMATAGKPIKRETADRILGEFLSRVREVNENDHYLYKVTLVVVFGSYLDAQKETLNDLDLAVDLEFKEAGMSKRKELLNARIREAREEGRQFGTHLAQVSWPITEAKQFLKSRSTAISLHEATTEQAIWQNNKHRIVFPSEGGRSRAIVCKPCPAGRRLLSFGEVSQDSSSWEYCKR
jgi:predicted nucleotidyltransferase